MKVKESTGESNESRRTCDCNNKSSNSKEYCNVEKCTESRKKVNLKMIPKGLPNLGNTCFFNSVMQCLMNTHPLNLYLEFLNNLECIENRYQYFTRINEKTVNVPTAIFNLPADVPMPLVTTFSSFIQDYNNNRMPSPNGLFNQVCRKAPRFRGFAQQDAHELLRYLLDGLRQEEIDRFKKAFLKYIDLIEDRTEMNDELLLRYKAYIEGAARPSLDAVFGGVLQQSIKCFNCGYISIRDEPFLDLSLPIFCPKSGKLATANYSDLPKELRKKEKKRLEKLAAEQEEQNKNGSQKQDSFKSKHLKKKELKNKKKLRKQNMKARNKKESMYSNIDELPLLPKVNVTDIAFKNGVSSDSEFTEEENDEEKNDQNGEQSTDESSQCASRTAVNDDIVELTKLDKVDFDSFGLSVINSLYLFTIPEVLSDLNAYACEKCCVDKNKKSDAVKNIKKRCVEASKRYLISKPPLILTLHLKRFEQIYNNGRMSTKKFRGFVEFGLTLDLAPFCRKSAKRIGFKQTEVLYSLYGIVSHSGDLGGGHYIAYVRARPQMESLIQKLFDECRKFEPDSLSNIISEKCGALSLNNDGNCVVMKNTQNGNCEKIMSKNCQTKEHILRSQAQDMLNTLSTNSTWYSISDSYVHTVPESKVIGVEAYILFYERIY